MSVFHSNFKEKLIETLKAVLPILIIVLLLAFYAIIFILAFYVPGDFLAIAFDSGGVTTGPMTVPFIMSFGTGIASIRSDRHAEDDSFGLVSMCSIGPILAVLILGMIFNPASTEQVSEAIPIIDNTVDLWKLFFVADYGIDFQDKRKQAVQRYCCWSCCPDTGCL